MPRRAYSYRRFSSPQQAAGDSRRRQTEYARRLCEQHGWHLDDSLTLHDLGISAFHSKNAKVGALGEFLEAVQTGRVSRGSILIIESVDRLSRACIGQALQLFLGLLNAGIDLATANPERVYTAESINDIAGLLEPIIYMSRAHEESATKSERLREVWAEKKRRAAADRRPLGRHRPAWLRHTPTGYELIPEHASTVRHIFALARQGLGVNAIVAELRADPRYRPFGRSGRWHSGYLSQILTSPAAYGAYAVGERVEGRQQRTGALVHDYYPAVVPFELWQEVQAARQLRDRRPRGGRPARQDNNLFSGIVWHVPTRLPMVLESCKADYQYLRVTRSVGRPRADRHGVPYRAFETLVLATIEHLKPADVLDRPEDASERDNEITRLQAEVIALDHRLTTVQAAAADPEQDPTAIQALLAIVRQVAPAKAAAARRLEALKLNSRNGRVEALAAVQSLLHLLRRATAGTAEAEQLRRRIKGQLPSLVESIGVLTQAVNSQVKLFHLQIRLRNGKRLHCPIIPDNARSLPLWPVEDRDFAALTAADVAALAASPARDKRR
jgi:DNA invertase Pin-like site-specific DNA recombinase